MGIKAGIRWKLFFGGVGDLVKDVFAQPVAGGDGRMEEGALAGHADAEHYFFGREVVNGGPGINFFQSPFLEGGVQAGFGAFCRQALFPEGCVEAPPYLGAGSEVALEARVGHADETYKIACCFQLGGEQTVAILNDAFADGGDMRQGLFPAEQIGKVFSDQQVLVHPDKGLMVGLSPAAQQKAVCLYECSCQYLKEGFMVNGTGNGSIDNFIGAGGYRDGLHDLFMSQRYFCIQRHVYPEKIGNDEQVIEGRGRETFQDLFYFGIGFICFADDVLDGDIPFLCNGAQVFAEYHAHPFYPFHKL